MIERFPRLSPQDIGGGFTRPDRPSVRTNSQDAFIRIQDLTDAGAYGEAITHALQIKSPMLQARAFVDIGRVQGSSEDGNTGEAFVLALDAVARMKSNNPSSVEARREIREEVVSCLIEFGRFDEAEAVAHAITQGDASELAVETREGLLREVSHARLEAAMDQEPLMS